MQDARTDPLTRLANRRSIEETAAAELRRQRRSGKPTAVILCDIDEFKRINDEHGHDAGDRTIRSVGENLRSVMRTTDALGRWGGDEFLAILPETTVEEAARLAERIRAAMQSAAIPGLTGLHVTVSVGVAAITCDRTDSDVETFDRVVKAADEALYQAKAAGRNRTVSVPITESA